MSSIVVKDSARIASGVSVSTMTITSKAADLDAVRRAIRLGVDAIPQTVEAQTVEIREGVVRGVQKKRRKESVDHVPAGAVWRGVPITIPVRLDPHVGVRGNSIRAVGNFRNCVPFSAGKRGLKVFLSGSIQAWGFVETDDFHEFANIVLGILGAGTIDSTATKIALMITDAYLPAASKTRPIELRKLAVALASRARENEAVQFCPDEFSGVRVKLVHPTSTKPVSACIRASGNVKIYIGCPGVDHVSVLNVLWMRMRSMLDGLVEDSVPA
jgi:hypothetical protein